MDIEFVESGVIPEGLYVGDLIRLRELLKDSELLSKLDEVIAIEIELCKMGSEKAIQKAKAGDGKNIKAIK